MLSKSSVTFLFSLVRDELNTWFRLLFESKEHVKLLFRYKD